MAKAKRAVIFDFDGVIADSWRLHEQSWREVLKRHKLALPEEALAKSIGLSASATAELIGKELNAPIPPSELGNAKGERFAELAKTELKPMAGAPEALMRLHGDFAVGIAAIRRADGVRPFLDRFDLPSKTDVIVTVDELADTKDAQELITVTAKRLEVPVDRTVVVQDARHGVLDAKRAGMKVVAFDSNPKHELDFATADAVVSSLDELVPELINSVAAR